MRRPDVARYQDGDRLEDGSGNVGTVIACLSKRTGTTYLRVKIQRGPRAGEWEWPERFSPPRLDWDPNGIREVCPDCEREFLSVRDEHGLRRVFCRQCDRQEQERDRLKAATASPSHKFGTKWRG